MNAFALLGAVLAALMYIPLTVRIFRRTLVQNFATYFLWGLLDSVAAGSLLVQHGNFLLPATYVAACGAVLVAIVRTRTFAWSWRETATSVFVVASILVWFCVGSEMATIVSTAGVVAAGLPQLYDLWKKPQGAPVLAYVGFTVANALSTMAGHGWTIQERLYGSACTVLTVVFVLVGSRKWLPPYGREPLSYHVLKRLYRTYLSSRVYRLLKKSYRAYFALALLLGFHRHVYRVSSHWGSDSRKYGGARYAAAWFATTMLVDDGYHQCPGCLWATGTKDEHVRTVGWCFKEEVRHLSHKRKSGWWLNDDIRRLTELSQYRREHQARRPPA